MLDLCLNCAYVVISQSAVALQISYQFARAVLLIWLGLLNKSTAIW